MTADTTGGQLGTAEREETWRRLGSETFDLVVPANSSTGYHWKIITQLDSNVVEFVTEDYVAQEPIMPGSGGMDVWTFRGINPGDTTIELGYYPPSNETQPDETVTFSIRVE